MEISIKPELNEDCLVEIFAYLSLDDMMQVKNVCRKWRQGSQQWFKGVQSLILTKNKSDNSLWELREKSFTRLLCSGHSWKKLISILNLCSDHMKYLNMNEKSIIDEPIVKSILKLIPKLKNIMNFTIIRSNFIKCPFLELMSMYCKKLEKLEVQSLSKLDLNNLNKLLLNNEQLKSLSLVLKRTMDYIPDEFFSCLPKTIEEIRINYMLISGENQWRHFIFASENFTSLHSLEFSGVNYLSDAAVVAISNIKTLTHLNLKHTEFQSLKTIDPIKNLKDLKSLNLMHNRKISEDALINIVESCIQLEHLNIFNINMLTDQGMNAIGTLKRLKFLFITGWYCTLESVINLCDRLEVLVLWGPIDNVSDAVKLLKKATNLKFVDLDLGYDLLAEILPIAREIANERKNVLYLSGENKVDFSDLDTPYFKYWKRAEMLPTEIFSNDVINMLNKFYEV